MQGHRLFIVGSTLLWLGLFALVSPLPPDLGVFSFYPLTNTQVFWLLVPGAILNLLLFYSYAHFLLPRFIKNRKIGYALLANGLLLLGFGLVDSLVDRGYSVLVFKWSGYEMAAPSLGDWFKLNLILNAGLLALANFYGFAYAWFRDQRNQRKLEQEKLRAELLALKHQINPHFLFNSLNSLYALALNNDDDETAGAIAQLAEMMRYLLYECNESRVPLEKEINYIRNYIELQKLRGQGTASILFEVDGDVSGKEVAPMILVPFIENAFKHGVSAVRPSEIAIRLTVRDDKLLFEVSNPIHPTPGREKSPFSGIGLQNVRKRLELLYPRDYNLGIDDSEGIHSAQLSITL